MAVCSFCDKHFDQQSSLACSGVCNRLFHYSCLSVSSDLGQFLSSVPGLSWKCTFCKDLPLSKQLSDIFDQRCSSIFSDLGAKFELMKDQFMKLAADKLNELSTSVLSSVPLTPAVPTSSSAVTFADKLRLSPHTKIIIKPKNQEQSISKTKRDILDNVNPINADININKVKHIKNGGVVIDCQHKADGSKFQKIANDKMSNNYIIREVKNILPRVRVVGFTELYNQDTLLRFIKRQNADLFLANSECNVVEIKSTKKRSDIYQALLQVDLSLYAKLLDSGQLMIGLDTCDIYDALSVPRCFKCNKFNHSKKFCKNRLSCPRCAGDHDIAKCTSDIKCCSNCKIIKASNDLDFDVSHCVWDYAKCRSYELAVEKLKSDVFGIK